MMEFGGKSSFNLGLDSKIARCAYIIRFCLLGIVFQICDCFTYLKIYLLFINYYPQYVLLLRAFLILILNGRIYFWLIL